MNSLLRFPICHQMMIGFLSIKIYKYCKITKCCLTITNTHTHTCTTYCKGTLIYTAHDAHTPQMERAGTAARPAGTPWVGGVFWHAHKITHSYSSVSEQHVFNTHMLSHKNNRCMFRWETQMPHTANTCNSPSCITFAFINVPDIFIQSTIQCIRVHTILISMCDSLGNQTRDLAIAS